MNEIRLSVMPLEAREVPATLIDLVGGALTYTGGGGANVLTVSVAGGIYTFNDAGETITLGAGAVGVGWTGSGTATVRGFDSTVSSIAINGGAGGDTINIRSAGDDIVIDGQADTDTVNLSSNAPTNTGNLNGILGTVGVTAENLVASDYSATANNPAVVIGATTITGLAPGAITYAVGSLRVVGSNNAGHAEGYTVDSPAAALRLDTNAGADSVTVRATASATTINTGAGSDAVLLADDAGTLDGILGAVTLDLGPGANTLTLDDSGAATPASAGVTNATVTGFAPADVSYQSTGGTLTLTLIAPAAGGAVSAGTLPGAYTLDLVGDWTVV